MLSRSVRSAVAKSAVAAAIGVGACAAGVTRLESGANSAHHLDADMAVRGIATKVAKVSAGVRTIVLTGGPCGGKSSSLDKIIETFAAKGYDVLAAPEVPTILMNGGCRYPGIDGGKKLEDFEIALMSLQMQMEDSFRRVARSTGRPTLLVLDRGMADPAAYIRTKDMDKVLRAQGWSREGILSRYDIVIHLVTAADGAESFYTTANNAARTETAAQARDLDRAVAECYAAHPRHVVIDNSTDFEGKLARVTAAIDDMLAEDAEAGRRA